MIFADQGQDVIDVDLHLLDELHLENEVIVHILTFAFGLIPEIVVKVDINAVVVLDITLTENFISGEIIERCQNIA